MITGPTTHSFISQGLRLRYVDWGNPNAPPLILLHGGRDHSRSWDWTAQALREDWHVIAPDLRGHGDSDWSHTGDYTMMANLYDFAQLIHQTGLAPVTIVAHSYGGNIALRYSGIYPENVRKLVAIEGLGPSPKMLEERAGRPIDERMREWIDTRRAISGRQPRRYKSLEEAYERMKDANHHLSDAQARHLTLHGVSQNEEAAIAGSSTTPSASSRPSICLNRTSSVCGDGSPAPPSCSTARTAGPPTPKKTAASNISTPPASSCTKTPATGCITTSSTASSPS